MSATRSAPEQGYDFGNKRQYRRDIWSKFRRSSYWRANPTAIVLPSLEGDEIEVALSKGIRQDRLHVVDRNPAIVAHLKRRYPMIRTYGVPLDRALDRIAQAVPDGVTFANLDLCAPMSRAVVRTLADLVPSGAVSDALVSVTMLRGRESGAVRDDIAAIREHGGVTDRVRTNWLRRSVEGPAEFRDRAESVEFSYALTSLEAAGKYRSVAGTQTMLWCMFSVHAQPCACIQCASVVFDSARMRWSVDEWLEKLARLSRITSVEPESIDALLRRATTRVLRLARTSPRSTPIGQQAYLRHLRARFPLPDATETQWDMTDPYLRATNKGGRRICGVYGTRAEAEGALAELSVDARVDVERRRGRHG